MGGLSIPLSPLYDLPVVSSGSPLLKKMLPGYKGGPITVPPPITIGWPWEANTPESFYLYERFGDPRF